MRTNEFRNEKPDDFLCKNVGYDYIGPNLEIRNKINDVQFNF